jgi:hypothetical protein
VALVIAPAIRDDDTRSAPAYATPRCPRCDRGRPHSGP